MVLLVFDFFGEFDRAMPNQVVKASRESVASYMTCPLCHKLFRDATTIIECLHTCEWLLACCNCLDSWISLVIWCEFIKLSPVMGCDGGCFIWVFCVEFVIYEFRFLVLWDRVPAMWELHVFMDCLCEFLYPYSACWIYVSVCLVGSLFMCAYIYELIAITIR